MSSVYKVSKKDIITEALEIIGVLAEGEEPSDDEMTSVGRSLNMLIKAWQTEGIHIWAVDELEIPLEPDKIQYEVGPDKDIDVSFRPIRVVDGVYRDGDYDIPINIWSRQEYWQLSYKESTGTPLNIYFDRRAEYGIINVWQAPVKEDTKLILLVQRGLDTVEENDDNIDFPGEYFLSVAWNLARVIAPKYGVPQWMQNIIITNAEQYKMDAEGYNREDETSIYIEPDHRGGYRGYQ